MQAVGSASTPSVKPSAASHVGSTALLEYLLVTVDSVGVLTCAGFGYIARVIVRKVAMAPRMSSAGAPAMMASKSAG